MTYTATIHIEMPEVSSPEAAAELAVEALWNMLDEEIVVVVTNDITKEETVHTMGIL